MRCAAPASCLPWNGGQGPARVRRCRSRGLNTTRSAAETSVFTGVFAMLRPVRTRIEGRLVNSALVTGSFFQVLGVQAALGPTLTPQDDERFASRPVIVLSHRG